MAYFLPRRGLARSKTGLEEGIAMKSVYPMTPVRRRRSKRPTKLKAVAAANIAQRYMELLRLRAILHEVEAKPRVR
jgi:hypothetical protein